MIWGPGACGTPPELRDEILTVSHGGKLIQRHGDCRRVRKHQTPALGESGPRVGRDWPPDACRAQIAAQNQGMRCLPQPGENAGIRRHSDDRIVAKCHSLARRTWPTAQCRDGLGTGPAGAGAIAVVVLGWCCVSMADYLIFGEQKCQPKKIHLQRENASSAKDISTESVTEIFFKTQ